MRLEQGVTAALDALSPAVNGFHEFAPQAQAHPFVTFQRISTVRGDSLDGPYSYTDVRVQFDIWGNSTSSVQGIAAQLRTLFDGHTGDLGGVVVLYAMLDNETDLSSLEGDREVRRLSMDFVFTLHE